jgi:hypothetical protein
LFNNTIYIINIFIYYIKMSLIEYSSGLTISSGNSGDIVFNPSGALKIGSNAVLDASALGSSVQAYHSHLNDIASISGQSNNDSIKWNGSAWVASAEVDPVKSVDDSTLQEVSNVYSVKDGGVGTTQLADSAVTGAKLGADCVDGSKLADDCIDSEHIKDGVIDANHINTAQVPTLGASNTFTNALNVFNGVTVKAQLSHQYASQNSYDYKQRAEVQTTDDTVSTLWSVTPDDNALTHVEAVVMCCSDDASKNGVYKVKHSYKKVSAGAPSLLHSSIETVHETDALLSVSMDINSNDLRLRVTGLTSTNLRWSGNVKVDSCPLYSA